MARHDSRRVGFVVDVIKMLRIILDGVVQRRINRADLHRLAYLRAHQLPVTIAHGRIASPDRRIAIPLPEARRISAAVFTPQHGRIVDAI